METITKTHREHHQERHSAIRSAIMALFGFSEDEYLEHLFENGCKYAMIFARYQESAARMLTGYEGYWAWFKGQYYSMDDAIVREFRAGGLQQYNLQQVRIAYHYQHITMKLYPTQSIVAAAYQKQMMNYELEIEKVETLKTS